VISGGGTRADAVETLAAGYALTPEALAPHVDRALGEWQTLGLLAPAVPDADDRVSRWRFHLGTHVFELVVDPCDDAPILRAFYRQTDSGPEPADAIIEVRAGRGGERSVYADGREVVTTSDSGLIMGAVQQSMLEHVHPATVWIALLHGAAVKRGSAGIALPARSGSGKSTLTAYLARNGFEYLADDLIAIAEPDGVIVPWPMPQSIKAGSWEVLASAYPELADRTSYATKRTEAKLLHHDAGPHTAAPLRVIVFPAFASGARLDCRRLEPFDAMQRLLSDRIWLGYPLKRHAVARFVTLLETIPAYELAYDSLSDARQVLMELPGIDR
jgi:hypothetical protein